MVNRSTVQVNLFSLRTDTCAKYTSVPVQYDVRRSHQKQNTKQRNQPGTNKTTKPKKPNKAKIRPRQEDKPKAHRRRSHKHQPRQRTTRRAHKAQQNEGAGGRRQAETSKEGKSRRPGRQQDRREKAAQAKNAVFCLFWFGCGCVVFVCCFLLFLVVFFWFLAGTAHWTAYRSTTSTFVAIDK